MPSSAKIVGSAALLLLALSSPLQAVTSSASVRSSFDGNGHNVSFDGRIFMTRDAGGWKVMIMRPEAITFGPDGLPDATGSMWSDRFAIIDNPEIVENALALCEVDSGRAPYRCDEAGNAAAGPYDCYDFWVLDSDAATPADQGGAIMRRRHMTLWISDPHSPSASFHKADLSSTLQPLSPVMHGIEPTVTADGKLMLWQGDMNNDGLGADGGAMMYSYNANACAAVGWSAPRPLSRMSTDPLVVGKYRLAERALRAVDGTPFSPGDPVLGAYPWLMPDGSAVTFAAAPMPCRAENDPPGCGPRRNSIAVLGYPTNWAIAVVDGAINPESDNGVRLFFSSPGRQFAQLPVTQGLDVWPFFGSNTSNYVELIFDDGLDGNYAGFWHFNESVTKAEDAHLDMLTAPDVSGYFNTGKLLGGLQVSTFNNGVVGRALTFDGVDDRVSVPHSITLNPINGITIDFWIRPNDPNCDGGNNYRFLLGKGTSLGQSPYNLVLEDDRSLRVRFRIEGEDEPHSFLAPPLPLDQWTHVACEWDGPTGKAACYYGDQQVVADQLPVGTLASNNQPLLIGAPGARPACPANGDGAYGGMLDELSISRYARHLGEAPANGADAGPGGVDAGAGPGGGADDPDDTDGNRHGIGGCGCQTGGPGGAGTIALLAFALLIAIRRRR